MERRKDYILDRWTYLATNRAKRPDQFAQAPPEMKGTDIFAPGQEHLTPNEIGRMPDGAGGWRMRWFPNKFPAVTLDKEIKAVRKGFFQHDDSYGTHDIIVELAESDRQLWDLDDCDLVDVLRLYKERVITLQKMKGIEYVVLFKNHRSKAGASLQHSHTQVITLARVPRLVEREIEASKKKKNIPLLRATLAEIKKGERIIHETADWVSICPYAPRFNFEAWVLPKKEVFTFDRVLVADLKQMAEHFGIILRKLRDLQAPYNYYFHYDPTGSDLPLHCEITPRFNTRAGFELAAEDSILTVTPEQAAEYYRS